jgi:hypothetical protein
MPTTIGTNVTSWAAYANSGLRMYDVADRDQQTFNLRLNRQLGAALDLSLSGQVKNADYPDAEYGRQKRYQRTINLDLNYQPSASRNIFAFVGYQNGSTGQSSISNTGTCNIGQVTDLGTITPLNAAEICAAPGGPIYPLNFAWSSTTREKNYNVGFGADQQLGKTRLSLDYTRTFGRSAISYSYIPGGAIAVATAPLAGSGMPDMLTAQDTLDLGLTAPVGRRVALRLGYRLETGDVEDWHYQGLDTTRVVNANPANLPTAVILDSGPRDYRAHLATLAFQMKF